MKTYIITITSKRTKAVELKALLEQNLPPDRAEIALEVRKREQVFRGLDPTILVAIVGAAGAGLGAIITGLLQIAKQMSSRLITIQSKDGSKLVVPVGISKEELEMLIENVKKLDSDDIMISAP